MAPGPKNTNTIALELNQVIDGGRRATSQQAENQALKCIHSIASPLSAIETSFSLEWSSMISAGVVVKECLMRQCLV